MTPWVIRNFRKGRKTRRGEPLPPEEMPPAEVVTAVPIRDALRSFGCRDRGELTRHLQKLREQGKLISEPRRLTQRVQVGVRRAGKRRRIRAYVVRGERIPTYRPRGTGRALYW